MEILESGVHHAFAPVFNLLEGVAFVGGNASRDVSTGGWVIIVLIHSIDPSLHFIFSCYLLYSNIILYPII